MGGDTLAEARAPTEHVKVCAREDGPRGTDVGVGVGSRASNPEAGGGCKLAKRSQPPAGAPATDRALFGTAANLCAVPAESRVDCGYPEITPEQCNNRGCCFDSSIHGVPWCFKALQDTGRQPRQPGGLPGRPPPPPGKPPGPQDASHPWTRQPAPWLSVGEGASVRGIVHGWVSGQGLSPAVPWLGALGKL